RDLIVTGVQTCALPISDARLEEEPVDDQLAAALEQVEQAHRPARALEDVVLVDADAGHAPALGGQGVTGAGQLLLLDEEDATGGDRKSTRLNSSHDQNS